MESDPTNEEVVRRAELESAVSDLQSALSCCCVIDSGLSQSGFVDAGEKIADALAAVNRVTRLARDLRRLDRVSEEALMLIGAAVATAAFVRTAVSVAQAELDRLRDAA